MIALADKCFDKAQRFATLKAYHRAKFDKAVGLQRADDLENLAAVDRQVLEIALAAVGHRPEP